MKVSNNEHVSVEADPILIPYHGPIRQEIVELTSAVEQVADAINRQTDKM